MNYSVAEFGIWRVVAPYSLDTPDWKNFRLVFGDFTITWTVVP